MSHDRPESVRAAAAGELATHFASPQRQTGSALGVEVEAVSNNPVVDALLRSVGGLLAVLNADRQILAVNPALLSSLGVQDAGALLGLRPGEALKCGHAGEMPAGCGTSKHCGHCGAAIAIVTSLAQHRSEERLCDLALERDGRTVERCLSVRASPLEFEGQRLVLLFLRDVTDEQRRAALERVFFHDLNNLVGSLAGGVMLLDPAEPEEMTGLIRRIEEMAYRLGKEIEVQRTLAEAENGTSGPALREVELSGLLAEAVRRAGLHPHSQARRLRLEPLGAPLVLDTEPTVLARVLGNMLLNALEAIEPGAEVRLWAEEQSGAEVVIQVHNPGLVSPKNAERMFQRGNSSKAGTGRGFGTYSMRLFSERVLGGRVSFESSAAQGTVFKLHLPRRREVG